MSVNLDKLVTWFFNGVLWVLVLAFMIVVIAYCSKDVREEGYNAGKSGVPAVANPYIRDPYSSGRWLEGWMAGNADK